KRSKSSDMTITDAISQSVTHTARNLSVSAIITPTESGHTARMISKYRPQAPIVAVTFSDIISRQLSLAWGVYSILGKEANSTDEMLDIATDSGLSTNLFQRGTKVNIKAEVPVGKYGTTNLMKIHITDVIVAK